MNFAGLLKVGSSWFIITGTKLGRRQYLIPSLNVSLAFGGMQQNHFYIVSQHDKLYRNSVFNTGKLSYKYKLLLFSLAS